MRICLAIGFWITSGVGLAQAQMITAVGISPQGDNLLVAGDNRVLYTLDPENLGVTARRHAPGLIEWIDHSPDGRTVYLHAEDGTFEARSTGSFKLRYTFEKVSEVSYAPTANRIVLMENSYKGGILQVLEADSGKVLTRIDLEGIKTDRIGLGADGATALILTKYAASPSEPKTNPSNDLKDYAKYLFQQQNDGNVSTVISVDLVAGTSTSAETFYRVSFPSQVRMEGDGLAVIKGRPDSAFVSADGSTTLLDLGENFVSEARLSDDASTMMLSSGTKVGFYALTEGAVSSVGRTVEAARIPGPSERVTAADEATDGTMYLGTSAYRLWKIAPDAVSIEAVPVF